MAMIREQNTQQSRMVSSLMDNMNTSTNNTRRLIQGYMDNINTNHRPNSNPFFSFANASNNNINRNIDNTQSNATTYISPITYNIPSTPIWTNRQRGYLPNRRQQNNTVRRQQDNTARRQPRNTESGRRTLLNQILENTLYTSISRRPASLSDISMNVSNHLWREIINTTQTLCPITQENFVYDDRVSRIDHCGHLFREEALHTYLTEFDNRCPICRHNISTQPGNVLTPRQAPTPTPTPQQAPTPIPSSVFDISYSLNTFNNARTLQRMQSFSDPSYNTQPELEPEHSLPTTFGFGTGGISTAVSDLTTAVVSSLNTVINNPDNSGNMITAEYSIFVPIITNNNSTSTEPDDLVL
jgi:hypothetical protein